MAQEAHDRHGRLRIVERIDRLAHGNAGDAKPVGKGVAELRPTYGPGYRIYYLQDGDGNGPAGVWRRQVHAASRITRAHELADEWHSKEDDNDEEE